MNLQQAKIILEKINRLYQSMTLDSKIDIHERDLMLSYIRKFHEAFSPLGAAPLIVPPKTTPAAIKKEKIAAPVMKEKVVAPPKVKEEVIVPPQPKPIKAIKVEEKYDPEFDEIKIEKEKKRATSAPKTNKPRPVPSVTPPPPSLKKIISKPIQSTKEYDVLFEQKEATDLSEKLSQAPIKDLTKAMSINERILTTNDLFDGNNQALNDTLKKLNTYTTFNEAKPFLAEVATEFKWASKGKKKKAQIFIKLISRRYK